jgi:hypothetical protein
MDKRFGIQVFPPPMPSTPAGRFALVADLTSPTVVYDDEGNVVETYDPILTPEEGLRLMDMPNLENVDPEVIADFDAANGTRKTRWILYSGECVTPDAMDNLDREFRAAQWALTKIEGLPVPVRTAMQNYVIMIAKLRSTSAKATDE